MSLTLPARTYVLFQLDKPKYQPSHDSSYQLDTCTVRVEPAMDLSLEHLQYPENLVTDLGLQTSLNAQGLIIVGKIRG